jgi:hypothetical protein
MNTTQSDMSPFGVTETQVQLNLDSVTIFEEKKGKK